MGKLEWLVQSEMGILKSIYSTDGSIERNRGEHDSEIRIQMVIGNLMGVWALGETVE